MLPNLEYLILRSASDFGSKPLRFEQVKHVEFEQVRPYSMQMISFPRMESLKISIGAEYCDTYAEFFERHKGLKVLHLVWRRNGEFNRYMYLISLLPELIKLTIESINHINIDMIKKIISSHEQLMALELFSLMRSISKWNMTWSIFGQNLKIGILRKEIARNI